MPGVESKRGQNFHGEINTRDLQLSWREAPWDSAIFGYPVLQIAQIKVMGSAAETDFSAFERARDEAGSALVSCRLAHDCLQESILLENRGFRFIEMLYQPEVSNLQNQKIEGPTDLEAIRATAQDMGFVEQIAGSAFRNERFHVDPRLDPALGDRRYRQWVRNSLNHPNQELHVIRDRNEPVAFFITELLKDGTCYWHLNAVSPEAQGQGYGRRAWQTMLQQARQSGANKVQTSIVARNHRVLNLYARLGFYFAPPMMTFHWVARS